MMADLSVVKYDILPIVTDYVPCYRCVSGYEGNRCSRVSVKSSYRDDNSPLNDYAVCCSLSTQLTFTKSNYRKRARANTNGSPSFSSHYNFSYVSLLINTNVILVVIVLNSCERSSISLFSCTCTIETCLTLLELQP